MDLFEYQEQSFSIHSDDDSSNNNNNNNDHLLKIFHKIKNIKNLLNLLCDSVFDDICGHNFIKQALILALFGGTSKVDLQYPNLSIRDHIHILLVGNRWSEKNAFLKRLTSLMNNTCYIVGNCSSIKLIATTLNQKGHVVGNGALINQNRCIACIDELEKMSHIQQQIIIQSIEHQKIGVRGEMSTPICYPSNVTFIGASHLKSNEYDLNKNLEQNLQISQDLLRKFDLIYLIDDDQYGFTYGYDDELLFEKEIKKINKNNSNNSDINSMNDELILNELLEYQNTNTFAQMIFDENNLLLSNIIFKYINYCYQNIHPVINNYLKQNIQSYISSGEIHSSIIKSKLRIYETISRLSEAHAKLHMKQEVNDEDVYIAISIMKEGLAFSSMQKQSKLFKNIKSNDIKPATLYQLLCESSKFLEKRQFSFDEIIELANKFIDINLTTTQISNLIFVLNEQALIIKKSHNLYELL